MTRQRRVLFLTDSLQSGGQERQLTLLAKSLPLEWTSRIFSLGHGPFAAEVRRVGIPLDISLRRWAQDPQPALHLWRLVSAWRPDVIHSYGYMGTLAAILPCRRYHIPLVDGSIRQANVPARRGRIWLWSLRRAQRVIANSRAGLEAFGISSERGRVVYNGLDPERLSMCVRTPHKPIAPFTAIMVGRMHPMKDYASFVEAARLAVQGDGKTWRFVAMGSGPQRSRLMEQTQDLAERGIFLMPEPSLEVLPHVREADVGVLMTSPGAHAEGCSNAIMEYMACGLPVVCSDSGGNRELVLDGQTGFVIPPGDVKALVDRLLWLRRNPEEAIRLGNAGRRRLQTQFTVDRLVTGTLSVYTDVLAERRR
jgi:glycosyltransferase involved in cell wall biosynthesis